MKSRVVNKTGKVRVTVTPLETGMFEVLHGVLYDDGSKEDALLIGPVTAKQAADLVELSRPISKH
jgi:hypothetical protein